MQKLFIHGNVGRDPELRYLSDGTAVCNFSVAVNRRWTSEDGEQHEVTTWFNCSAWNRMGEVIEEYVSGGDSIVVMGELRPDPDTGSPRIWEGNDGESRASFDVRVSNFDFGKSGSGGGGGGDGSMTPEPSAEEEEDTIPF